MYISSTTKLWAASGLIMLLSGCVLSPQKEEPESPVAKMPPPVPQKTKIKKPPRNKPVTGIPIDSPTPPVSTPIITEPTLPTSEPELSHGNRDYHIVLPGDTLTKLAKHYNRSEDDIKTWNGLRDKPLSVGQRLRVSPPDSTIPSSESDKDYHIVNFGETLFAIAQRYNESMSDLARWNNLEPPYKVEAGQKLRIAPPPTTMIPDSGDTAPVTLSNPGFHLVKPGESLQNIAEKYELPLTDLAKWNGIGSPYTIYPGLRLKLAPR